MNVDVFFRTDRRTEVTRREPTLNLDHQTQAPQVASASQSRWTTSTGQANAPLNSVRATRWGLVIIPLMDVRDATPLVLLALAACGNDAQTLMLSGAGIGALGGVTTPASAGYTHSHQR